MTQQQAQDADWIKIMIKDWFKNDTFTLSAMLPSADNFVLNFLLFYCSIILGLGFSV